MELPRPVRSWPAAVAGKTLFIADLHIGIEREYWRAGVRASGISKLVERAVGQILGKVKPKRIIVVGDLKHNIPDYTKKEALEVQRVAELLASQGELIIVKGNHDGDLEKILPWASIYPAHGIVVDEILAIHGHARPGSVDERVKAAVMGHIHPAVAIKHRFGQNLEKAFLLAQWNGIQALVLPAFSPAITGVDVRNSENIIGPIAKEFQRADAFLLDGTYMGRIL